MSPSHPGHPGHPSHPLRDRLLEPRASTPEGSIVPLGDPLRARIARGLVLPGGPGRPPAEPQVRRAAMSGHETDGSAAAA